MGTLCHYYFIDAILILFRYCGYWSTWKLTFT
jgi:hypothetical protein